MATTSVEIGRSPVRLDEGLNAGDRFVIQCQGADPALYARAAGTAAPTAASSTLYLGYPTVGTHSAFSHANLRGDGPNAPSNPVAGEMWFDNAHQLVVGQHRFAGRWQRAFSRTNPLSGQPETVWSQSATLAQLRTAFALSGLRWIAPELGADNVLVFSNGAALSPLGGEFANDAALFAWLARAGSAYDPSAEHLYYNASRGDVMRVTGAYSDQRSAGPALTVTFSQTGTKAEDLHARGVQGNTWTIRRMRTGATTVDPEKRVISVAGATAGDVKTSLEGLATLTLTVTLSGGATSTSPIGSSVDTYSFAGGADAGPADQANYLVLPANGRLVEMDVDSTPVWGWLAPQSNYAVGRIGRRTL